MKLKSLEMIGFKSFVDRTLLSFGDGITAIVGPNGCGKSNIVDSFLWVVGERSARHLRGKLMEDVIFSGADGRKPLGMAEVSLTFINDGNKLPPQFSQYEEITITRRLFRSGESEYFINKIPCRLRDITDLFLDSGISPDGYCIVEQGRIEHLIKANPEERRFLIEEAAGIAKYKERKRLAILKMEATQQNLQRIQDVIAEVKRQILSLERQVKRAEEYRAIRKEIKEIEMAFALKEYEELSEKAEATRGYLKALRDREAEISVRNSEKEALLEGMRLKGVEDEERLRTLQQECFEIGRRVQRLESEIEFLRKEDESLKKQQMQALEEMRDYRKSLRDARRERAGLEDARKHLEEEYTRHKEGGKQLEADFSCLRSTQQEILMQLEKEKGELIDTLSRLALKKNLLSHLGERRSAIEKQLHINQEETEKTLTEAACLEKKILNENREKEKIISLQSALQKQSDELEKEIASHKEALSRKRNGRIACEQELLQDRSRYLSLKELQDNFEGYDRGVRSMLLKKREDPDRWCGLLGTVMEIFEPEAEYLRPLEAALDRTLQHIIVEDSQLAVDGISILKKEGLGRCSFIVRGIVDCEGQANSSRKAHEKPLPLVRVAKPKGEFASLAQSLIGDVGVVDNLQEALEYVRNGSSFGTVVTMDGDVVERHGVITGGSRDQRASILERQREIKELEIKVRQKEEKYRGLVEEENRIERELSEKESLLERHKKDIQGIEVEIVHKQRNVEQFERDLTQSREKIEILQFEKEGLLKEKEQIEREEQATRAEIEELLIVRDRQEEAVQRLKSRAEQVQKEFERLGRDVTENKVRLASLEEKLKAIDHRISSFSENMAVLREKTIQKVESLRFFRRELQDRRVKIGEKEGEMQRLLLTLRDYEQQVVEQKEKVEKLLNEIREAETSSRYLRSELEEVRQKIHEEEMSVSEIDLRMEHLQRSVRERYGTPLQHMNSEGVKATPEMAQRLEELKKSLDGFGEVNLLALEEYQELRQRCDFLTEQQADLQQALDSLKKAIARINRTSTRRFVETFHRVNEGFKQVFEKLFDGGQASLVMIDEQDPSTTGIDIIAQPPGKRLQNIDLLSGGEKALVAIALVFAIFMIKPSPFCLLDEVDAPLDDANIGRFVALLEEFSKYSQFIIITHNKKSMETANTLYGITMETPGVSKVVSVKLN